MACDEAIIKGHAKRMTCDYTRPREGERPEGLYEACFLRGAPNDVGVTSNSRRFMLSNSPGGNMAFENSPFKLTQAVQRWIGIDGGWGGGWVRTSDSLQNLHHGVESHEASV